MASKIYFLNMKDLEPGQLQLFFNIKRLRFCTQRLNYFQSFGTSVIPPVGIVKNIQLQATQSQIL